MQVILDAQKMKTRETAHEYLKQKLGLPDYYGKNLDALYDCLAEQDALEIILQNVPYEDTDSYFSRIVRVLTKASLENPGVKIRLEMDERE